MKLVHELININYELCRTKSDSAAVSKSHVGMGQNPIPYPAGEHQNSW